MSRTFVYSGLPSYSPTSPLYSPTSPSYSPTAITPSDINARSKSVTQPLPDSLPEELVCCVCLEGGLGGAVGVHLTCQNHAVCSECAPKITERGGCPQCGSFTDPGAREFFRRGPVPAPGLNEVFARAQRAFDQQSTLDVLRAKVASLEHALKDYEGTTRALEEVTKHAYKLEHRLRRATDSVGEAFLAGVSAGKRRRVE